MGPLPRIISIDIQQSINRILAVFDDSVQFGLVSLRLDEIRSVSAV